QRQLALGAAERQRKVAGRRWRHGSPAGVIAIALCRRLALLAVGVQFFDQFAQVARLGRQLLGLLGAVLRLLAPLLLGPRLLAQQRFQPLPLALQRGGGAPELGGVALGLLAQAGQVLQFGAQFGRRRLDARDDRAQQQ